MKSSRRAALIAAMAGIVAAGCAHATREGGGGSGAQSVFQASNEEAPVIQVRNRHWQDVNVYVVLAGSRFRLGTVSSNHTERFPIARLAGWDTHPLKLYVDPIGTTETFTTEDFYLGGGQWADCVVEGTLRLSSYMVRNY
ncbi:MAG TPA: hypothetical protein VF832_04080 [Longimicrobiales bacterium]